MKNVLVPLTTLAFVVSACSITINSERTDATSTPVPVATKTQTPTPESDTTATTTPDEETRVGQLVVEFGSRFQLVSLTDSDAAAQIEAQYALFVSPELLAAWMANPSIAPGRETSSPWPDHIEILAITREDADTMHVEAVVVEATNDDPDVARTFVNIQIERVDGKWVIIQYTKVSREVG